MELRLTFPYPASARAVYGALLSPEYRRAAAELSGDQSQRVVHEHDDGERQQRVVELSGPNVVPAPVAKLLRIPPMTFRIEETYHHDQLAWQWQLRPSQLEKRVTIRGSERLVDEPGQAGATRTVELTAEVRMPLVGAKVEKALLESLRSNIEATVEVDRRWLREAEAGTGPLAHVKGRQG